MLFGLALSTYSTMTRESKSAVSSSRTSTGILPSGLTSGTLLSAALFRHVIEVDRVRRVDFGTGNDAYKRDWMNRHEPLWRIEAFNPSRIAAWGPASKAFVRSMLGKDT